MLKLVIQDDEGKTTVVPLIRDEITIGRKEGNTIRLTERNVSRRHARILRTNGSVAIEDLNSYNGIRINGSRIQGRSGLDVSDRVQIGDYLIEVKSEADKVDSVEDQETKPVERISGHIPAHGATAIVAAPAHLAETVPVPQAPPQDIAVHAPAAQAGTPPRLVVLSTNFAGQEFDLDKPALVIGRTPDNDIVIDHRSISRHHAKVVQENGRYAIVDLQSSNGVRVNGEDYGKVELRRGDMVDLGHVRMRFVEAGEDFLFGRDAQPVDIGGGGRSMGMILAALLVIGGGIGIFVMTRGGDDKAQSAGPAPGAGSADVAIVAPAVTIDAAAEVTPPPDDGSEEIKGLLADAAAAIDADKWADAQAAAQKVLDIDPANAAAKNIEEQARREIANALRHKDFEKAVRARNYAQVATLFEGIDHDSVYKDRARDDHDRLRDDYIQAAEGKASKLADAGKCKDIRKVAAQYTAWPEAGKVVSDIEAGCKDAVAVSPPIDKKPPPDDKKPPPDDPKPPASGKTAAQLVEEAKAAAKGAQFGRALRLCEEALSISKNDQEAAMVCAIAACNLKNEAKAKKHIGKLTNAQRKGMSRQICLRNGVNID